MPHKNPRRWWVPHLFYKYDNIKVRGGRILSPFDYFLVLNYVKAVSSVEAERDFL